MKDITIIFTPPGSFGENSLYITNRVSGSVLELQLQNTIELPSSVVVKKMLLVCNKHLR